MSEHCPPPDSNHTDTGHAAGTFFGNPGFMEGPMTAINYSRLAALIFAIVAVLQLARAVSGWPVTVGTSISIPLWASWIACVVAAGLAWLGFDASRA
jgi:hypothetical protein